MPWFKTENGEVYLTERALKKRQQLAEARKSEAAAAAAGIHAPHVAPPGNWPMASDAAGVDPSQIPEQMAHDAEAGVPTEYTKTGEPILTSPSHRKRYMHANGLCDRNAGYSDPEPIGSVPHPESE